MGRQRDGLSPLAGGGLGTRLKFASSALEPHETLFHLTNKPPHLPESQLLLLARRGTKESTRGSIPCIRAPRGFGGKT